jgi:hypothetical protein
MQVASAALEFKNVSHERIGPLFKVFVWINAD